MRDRSREPSIAARERTVSQDLDRLRVTTAREDQSACVGNVPSSSRIGISAKPSQGTGRGHRSAEGSVGSLQEVTEKVQELRCHLAVNRSEIDAEKQRLHRLRSGLNELLPHLEVWMSFLGDLRPGNEDPIPASHQNRYQELRQPIVDEYEPFRARVEAIWPNDLEMYTGIQVLRTISTRPALVSCLLSLIQRYQRVDAVSRAQGAIDIMLRRYEHHLAREEAAIPPRWKSALLSTQGAARRVVIWLEWMEHNKLPTLVILVLLLVVLFALFPGSDLLFARAVEIVKSMFPSSPAR